jgi:hypothetical protein
MIPIRFQIVGLIAGAIAGIIWPLSAQAVDHNNLDAGRPLSFEDAESIAILVSGGGMND